MRRARNSNNFRSFLKRIFSPTRLNALAGLPSGSHVTFRFIAAHRPPFSPECCATLSQNGLRIPAYRVIDFSAHIIYAQNVKILTHYHFQL
jgi:hypothetical protein